MVAFTDCDSDSVRVIAPVFLMRSCCVHFEEQCTRGSLYGPLVQQNCFFTHLSEGI